MIALSLLILLQAVILGVFTLRYLGDSLEEQMGQRALQLASMISQTPSIRDAVARGDSPTVQSIVADLRLATDASFISIGDAAGIRLVHPVPERIGKPMVGGDNYRALELGESYISKAVGSLGESIRGKTPVFDDLGKVVGVVSVGYLTTTIEQTVSNYQETIIIVTWALLALSILIAFYIGRRFRAAIFDLEPHEIAALFLERNATLESVREGIIAINAEGKITTFNRAALKALNLPEDKILTGKPLNDVLPESRLPAMLETGSPEYDRETFINGRTLIINRLPIMRGDDLVGIVASFRPKDELAEVSRQLTRIRQYADALRSQAHEYANKLHTIAGLISIDAKDEALELIGQETAGHQALLSWIKESVDDHLFAGLLLGKYNRANELGLRLEIDTDSNLSKLPEHIDSQQLVTLVGNLIDNALEATLSNNSEQVSLSFTDLGEEILVEVEDQGAGIAPEQREAIFRQGYSTKGENRGIGLHLVNEICDQLNAKITVETITPRGSRFTLYIPRSNVVGNDKAQNAVESSTISRSKDV